jgi:hypothetical protein
MLAAEITKAVSWPIVTLILGLVFRKPALHLFEAIKLRKLKVGALEMDFDEKLESAQAKLPVAKSEERVFADLRLAPGAASMSSEVPTPVADQDLLVHAPIGAMMASWAVLEMTLNEAVVAQSTEGNLFSRLSALAAARRLKDLGVVASAVVDVIKDLQDARNTLVHSATVSDHPTQAQARKFVETVDDVCRIIAATNKQANARSLKDLLAALQVDLASKVRVAPMAAVGSSHSARHAEQQANWRSGRYVAKAGPIRMALTSTERDRLVANGAVEVPAENALDLDA